MKIAHLFPLFVLLFSSAAAAWFENASVRSARVSKVGGRVVVKKVGSDQWLTARVGMRLEESDRIRSSESSWASLDMGGNAFLRVSSSSDVTLAQLVEKGKKFLTDIKVEEGSIITRVKKLRKNQDVFRISTPTLVAGVRGTIVYTEVRDGVGSMASDPQNERGSLEVFSPTGEEKKIDLNPGMVVSGKKDGSLTDARFLTEEEFGKWGIVIENISGSKPPKKEAEATAALSQSIDKLIAELKEHDQKSRDALLALEPQKWSDSLDSIVNSLDQRYLHYRAQGYDTHRLHHLKNKSLELTEILKRVNKKVMEALKEKLQGK